MKRTVQIICGLFILSIGALAQPTLTAVGCNPVVGDQFVNISSAYLSPGSSGASQTWNFAGMTTGASSTQTVVAVSSTSYSASFANSNLAITANGTSFEYYNANNASYQSFGSGSASSVDSYTNGDDRLHYPFNYNSSYNDIFSSTYTSGANTIKRYGWSTVTADGYGTLTTPVGTFNNTMRVHLIMTFHDSTVNTGAVTVFQRDQYVWYLNGNHASLANVSSFTVTPSGGSPIINQGAGYLSNAITGISSVSASEIATSLFPNPAANFVTFAVDLEKNLEVGVKVFNSLGAIAIPAISFKGMHGNNEFKVDLALLPEGVYFAQIHLDGALTATRKFVISR